MDDESTRFGPYEVHECVGSGGMATVHRATIELGGGVRREVALKRLLPHLADDDRFVDDFVREAKLAVHLRHPNIIQIFDLGRIGEDYFIAMELVRGVPLMTLMKAAAKRDRLLPIGAVLSLMLELTDALDHAHNGTSAHGDPIQLVHRDLTPSNLLVTEDGHLKIIDFGIAKALRGDLTTDSGRAKGKLGYMAIEALKADAVDARADLFSAGVVMWELLTNHRLFKAPEDWDLMGALRNTIVKPPSVWNPDCPRELDELVLCAVAREREHRWPTADALHHALVAIARNYNATPLDVVRAKQSLRPETSTDPYAGFELELEIDVDDEPLPAIQHTRKLDWTGPLWPAEPATEPKLRVEGTSSWPVEPATEPKMYTVDQLAAAGRTDKVPDASNWPPEPPSVSIREMPVKFSPSDFSGETPAGTVQPLDTSTDKMPVVPPVDEPLPRGATRSLYETHGDSTKPLRPVPAPEPPTEPRKPKPAKPKATRKPPPPVPQKRTTVRKPAPSPVVETPFDQQLETHRDAKAFKDTDASVELVDVKDDFDEE